MAPSEPRGARCLDAVAVEAALRRLARAPGLPWLHGEVARRMAQRLEPIRLKPQRVLDWWGGPGASAEVLREALPDAERVAVEPDRRWAARVAAAPTPWWQPWRRAAAAVFAAADSDLAIGSAQLVWSNMTLHAVVDPPALFARWQRLLEIDGVVLFSCLGPGTLRELRELYADLGWPSPTPGFIDMHDLGDMLVESGFAEPVLDQETLTLRWRGAEALLDELRTLGSNAAPDRHPGLRTPAWRRRLVDALTARAAPDGSIGLSFEIAYGHGFKAAPRPRPGEPQAVSLDEMRAMVRRPRDPGSR